MGSRDETTLAFLLRSADRGEADRLLTLFTEKKGKIRGIARGARKSRQRFGGALEPFALIEISIAPTRSHLYQLTSARTRAPHLELAADLGKASAAASVLEIVRELAAEGESDPRVFALVEEAIASIAAAGEAGPEPVVIAAMLRLIELAGITAAVDRCSACGRPVPDGRRAMFHPARGGVVCTPCGGGPVTLSAKGATALRALNRLRPAEARQVVLGEREFSELRAALVDFVAYHIGRPIGASRSSSPP